MYEIFTSLLDKTGKKASDVSKATGIPASTFSDWKKGKSAPKADKLQLIAEFFGVSLEYMMTGKEKEGGETYYINDDTREIAQKVFESKELRLLFDAAKDAKAEDIETTYNMLLALKRKEKGEI